MDNRLRIDNGSKVHHYIPKYFIQGFGDEAGQVHVYDKTVRRYLGPKFPSQVMYEMNGNTGYWDKERNTIPELSFSGVDALQAPKIHAIRSLTHEQVSEDLHGYLSHHMILQYLRVPANTSKYIQVYEEMPNWSKVLPDRPIYTQAAPSDDTFKKLTRAFLPTMLLRSLLEIDQGPWPSNLMEHNTEDYLVLTDNPVVYESTPIALIDLMSPCMMAICSRKFYLRGALKEPIPPIDLMLLYNMLAIGQAERYICASNQGLLERMMGLWLTTEDLRLNRKNGQS